MNSSAPTQPERSSQSNPAWSREELILALNVYVHNRPLPAKTHPIVLELSEFLGKMAATASPHFTSYRNPNGVYMKLMNFRRWDPDYTGAGKKGLTKGNKDEERVWNQFANDPVRLAEVVASIRNAIDYQIKTGETLIGPDEPEIVEAEEGRVLTRFHRTRERSRELVATKKKQVLKMTGKLECEACGFDFAKRYGAVGDGLIEVHHTRPLHTLEPGAITKLDELALLCANCHRVVHSRRKWLSLQELKTVLDTASLS